MPCNSHEVPLDSVGNSVQEPHLDKYVTLTVTVDHLSTSSQFLHYEQIIPVGNGATKNCTHFRRTSSIIIFICVEEFKSYAGSIATFLMEDIA